MRSSSSLYGGISWGSPYRLDILTIILKKIFNYNLFRVFHVFRGFLVAYGKKSLGEIINKIWPEARNYSITYESKSLNYNL